MVKEFNKTPFDELFAKVRVQILLKQRYEVHAIKDVYNSLVKLNEASKENPELGKLVESFTKMMVDISLKKQKKIKEMITPVKYKLEVTPVES